jgi:hypothetical protein
MPTSLHASRLALALLLLSLKKSERNTGLTGISCALYMRSFALAAANVDSQFQNDFFRVSVWSHSPVLR